MKAMYQSFTIYLAITLMAVLSSCSEDTVEPPGTIEELPSSIQLDEFETDEGAIGISISARNLARKGYKPTTAVISVAAGGVEDQTIPFDDFNNLANFSLQNEDLPDELEETLKNGVPVEVTVKDENENVIATETFSKLSFTPGPAEREVDDINLEDLYTEVSIREDVLHYMQIVSADNEVYGVPASDRYTNSDINTTAVEVRPVPIENVDYNDEYAKKFTAYFFRKVPDQDNVYVIYTKDGNDIHNWYVSVNEAVHLLVQSKRNIQINKKNTDPIASNLINYYFKINKEAPGLYTIIPVYSGNPLTLTNVNLPDGTRFQANDQSTSREPVYFRILALDIDWDIVPVEARFMNPIMPPSGNNSAYNSTLRNCSSGRLTQTIGETTTVTTVETFGWEESMTVSSTNEGSVSVTLGYEAETNFFGQKGKASASVTGSYTYTSTETQTNTQSGSLAEERSVQVSVSREIEVPPNTAISVADIYQQYENVKVPFVQRFRISGKYQESGNELSGQEILTQFAFNSFTGVVTDVQPDFIEVTVRGTTEIDRLIETSTESRDISGACN